MVRDRKTARANKEMPHGENALFVQIVIRRGCKRRRCLGALFNADRIGNADLCHNLIITSGRLARFYALYLHLATRNCFSRSKNLLDKCKCVSFVSKKMHISKKRNAMQKNKCLKEMQFIAYFKKSLPISSVLVSLHAVILAVILAKVISQSHQNGA